MTHQSVIAADQRPAILIVEDDPLIGLDLEMAFEDAGYRVVGPAFDVDAAMALLDETPVQMACLDYNLGSETSSPVARRLKRSGVDFVVATGLAHEVAADRDMPDVPILAKPIQPARVLQALAA